MSDFRTTIATGRRRFLAVGARYGFAVAVVALSGGRLFDDQAVAETAQDEAAKAAAAKVKMQFATEYRLEDLLTYPVLQAKFKENVERQSRNEIFVELMPAGARGIGAALAKQIQSGAVSGGSVSLSNFSPFTPVVDMINIPYWCGENQRFANLVTSSIWNDEITPKVLSNGYKPLFYLTVDSRTISTRHGAPPVRTPGDLKPIKVRTPPSAMLQQIYRLAGASTIVVPWGETATAIKGGTADALDPAITALATFGFPTLIGHVTFARTVPDAQMFAANAGWYQSLSDGQRRALDDAAALTQLETFDTIEHCRRVAMGLLAENGCKLHSLSEAEYAQWVDACGEQRPEWNEFKIKLAGSLDAFERFKRAANTKGAITVMDI